MLPDFNNVKGIHPGVILKRELKQRKIKGIELANSIIEHPQTINAITNERRGINPKLSIKLGEILGTYSDYFMLLQAAYEVKTIEKTNRLSRKSISNKFRKVIFWDININSIDWEINKKAVIIRVLERGNDYEIKELINHYGMDIIKNEIKIRERNFFPSYQENINKYIIED